MITFVKFSIIFVIIDNVSYRFSYSNHLILFHSLVKTSKKQQTLSNKIHFLDFWKQRLLAKYPNGIEILGFYFLHPENDMKSFKVVCITIK